MNILIVGGTWTEKDGMASSIIKKLDKEIRENTNARVRTYNGGSYEKLASIIELSTFYKSHLLKFF